MCDLTTGPHLKVEERDKHPTTYRKLMKEKLMNDSCLLWILKSEKIFMKTQKIK